MPKAQRDDAAPRHDAVQTIADDLKREVFGDATAAAEAGALTPPPLPLGILDRIGDLRERGVIHVEIARAIEMLVEKQDELEDRIATLEGAILAALPDDAGGAPLDLRSATNQSAAKGSAAVA